VGRHLLLSLGAVAVLVSGCLPEDGEPRRRGALADGAEAAPEVTRGPGEPGPHADLACARCHDGAPLERGQPAATTASCRGCHRDGGARTVSLGAVTIAHRKHPGESALEAGCAACHAHEGGDEELTVTTTGCVLCHAAELDGVEEGGCRTCHDPAHVARSSQGVAVAHLGLPWIGGECMRCHYDVGRPDPRVAASTCATCHRDAAAATARGAGVDLHPSHTGVTCRGCHEEAVHRIVSMSSGVRLSCEQCHATAHDAAAEEIAAATCNACHDGAHAAEQRLLLGAAPADLAATPGDKFLLGLTCRSCHVDAGDGTSTRPSCVGCHSPEYATVLTWWERGSAERVATASRYVAASVAAAAGAASDSARIHAAAADSLVRFVRAGGPAHNLPLSHRALEVALERAAASWAAAGRAAPPRPNLGRTPQMGLCTYCHYTWQEPRVQGDMPDAFHRRVMQRGRESARSIGVAPP
jgi:hypothetical protein